MAKAQRPLEISPRGLGRDCAARYVGISPTKFDQLVADGRMPAAKRIDGRKVWDRQQLDLYFDALPSDGSGEDDSRPNDFDSFLGIKR